MAKWQLRRARPHDSEALSTCIEAAYSVYATRLTDLPAVSEGIAEDIEEHLVLVAEIDQEIVGGIILVPKDGFVVLANIAVHPETKGFGLGRALIELAETECLALGLTELRLTTHVDIPENVRIYAHLGWRELNRDGNKIQMTKFLK